MTEPCTIRVDKRETIVERKFDASMLSLARNLPAQYKWSGRTLIARTCRANIDFLREQFPDAEFIDEDGALAEIEIVSNLKRTKGDSWIAYVFRTDKPPFDYQKECFYCSCSRRVYALFLEMGLGKTKILIDTACYLFSLGLIDRVLVIAPNGVHKQWALSQITVHTPEWCRIGSVHYWGESKARAAQQDRAPADGLKWFCINIEALSYSSGEVACENFLRGGAALTAVDESVRIKTPGSDRTRAMQRIRSQSKFRRIMSGRPLTKGIQDLYSQYGFLDPAIIGVTSYTAFKARYCVMGKEEKSREIVDYRNVDELIERIAPHTYVAEKKDYPAKVYVRRPVPITMEQRILYTEFTEDLMAEIDNGEIVDAENAAVKLMRLQQVLCGFLPRADGSFQRIKSNRIDVLKDVLADVNGKAVIWARFKEDIVQIKEALGDKCVVYTGGKDENNAIERWLTEPDLHFVGNPASGGTGLNLVCPGANTMIYYSNSFNADHRWQSEDRIHRIGVEGDCTYIDLTTPGTIDTKILYSFRRKLELSEEVLLHPRMMVFDDDEAIFDDSPHPDNEEMLPQMNLLKTASEKARAERI